MAVVSFWVSELSPGLDQIVGSEGGICLWSPALLGYRRVEYHEFAFETRSFCCLVGGPSLAGVG